jgi:hypothetical protein
VNSSVSFTIEDIETAIEQHGGYLGPVDGLRYRVERTDGDPGYRFFVCATCWAPTSVNVTIASDGQETGKS